jgi:hypothetical protein
MSSIRVVEDYNSTDDDDDDSSDSINKVDPSIFQNEISTDTINRAPTHIQPLLKILNDACVHVSRKLGELEINASTSTYPYVNADNFYGNKEIVTAISDARCFFMILKQLPPFPPTKVSIRKMKLFFPSFLINKLEYLLSVTTPYETFVSAHIRKGQNDSSLRTLGKKGKKG